MNSGQPCVCTTPLARLFFTIELYDSGYCSPSIKPSKTKRIQIKFLLLHSIIISSSYHETDDTLLPDGKGIYLSP